MWKQTQMYYCIFGESKWPVLCWVAFRFLPCANTQKKIRQLVYRSAFQILVILLYDLQKIDTLEMYSVNNWLHCFLLFSVLCGHRHITWRNVSVGNWLALLWKHTFATSKGAKSTLILGCNGSMLRQVHAICIISLMSQINIIIEQIYMALFKATKAMYIDPFINWHHIHTSGGTNSLKLYLEKLYLKKKKYK